MKRRKSFFLLSFFSCPFDNSDSFLRSSSFFPCHFFSKNVNANTLFLWRELNLPEERFLFLFPRDASEPERISWILVAMQICRYRDYAKQDILSSPPNNLSSLFLLKSFCLSLQEISNWFIWEREREREIARNQKTKQVFNRSHNCRKNVLLMHLILI